MQKSQKKSPKPNIAHPEHNIVKKKKVKKKTIKHKTKVKRKEIKKELIKPIVERKKKVPLAKVKKKPQIKEKSIKPIKSIASTPLDAPQKVTPQKTESMVEEKVQTEAVPPSLTAQKMYVKENLAEIIELLRENLYYPRRARKRGIEGEVIVSFKLSTTAEVSDVKVISSKNDILSRGAIRTIEDLSFKFPKPSEELDLKVPIFYKLH
jgi:protein TonB